MFGRSRGCQQPFALVVSTRAAREPDQIALASARTYETLWRVVRALLALGGELVLQTLVENETLAAEARVRASHAPHFALLRARRPAHLTLASFASRRHVTAAIRVTCTCTCTCIRLLCRVGCWRGLIVDAFFVLLSLAGGGMQRHVVVIAVVGLFDVVVVVVVVIVVLVALCVALIGLAEVVVVVLVGSSRRSLLAQQQQQQQQQQSNQIIHIFPLNTRAHRLTLIAHADLEALLHPASDAASSIVLVQVARALVRTPTTLATLVATLVKEGRACLAH